MPTSSTVKISHYEDGRPRFWAMSQIRITWNSLTTLTGIVVIQNTYIILVDLYLPQIKLNVYLYQLLLIVKSDLFNKKI